MAVQITISGTRDDLVKHLEGLAEQRRAAAKLAGKPVDAQRQTGAAEGLEEAITALVQWQDSWAGGSASAIQPAEVPGEGRHASVFTPAEYPGDTHG